MGKGDRKTKKGKLHAKKRSKRTPYNFARNKQSLTSNVVIDHSKMKQITDKLGDLYRQKTTNAFMLEFLSDFPDESKKPFYEKNVSLDLEIKKIRDGLFQFSIEEIYHMYGRYDKFVEIKFHPNSYSESVFGNSVTGIIQYSRREREDIEKNLKMTPMPRTNGLVRIDSSDDNLSEIQINELRVNGFMSGDIFEIWSTSISQDDRYNVTDLKEIPNTHIVPFIATVEEMELLNLRIYEAKIINNNPLLQSERDHYYALMIIHRQDQITNEEWVKYIYDENSTNIRKSIKYYILTNKFVRAIITLDELKELSTLMNDRRKESNEILIREINLSSNSKLKDIISDTDLKELQDIAYNFKELNLSPICSKHPVSLDLSRFLHIFLRHFKDFQVGDWREKKTSFQYNFDDTKRVIQNVIKNLQKDIDEKIDQGKEFRIYDLKAHYYDGTYYCVHINKEGQLLSFYPHEKNKRGKAPLSTK